jgi:beta-glucosidase
MKKIIFIILLIFSFKIHSQDLKNIDERLKELLSKMTLDEKISQMTALNSLAIPRLNIPFYNWGNECLHGLLMDSVTVFPQSIALASTWDIDLMKMVASAISDEARVKFKQNRCGLDFWSPNINIFRDPRWGRGQETYGEDPYLTSRIAIAFIKGIQGEDKHYLKAIATTKHYAIHSGPEPLRYSFNAVTSERDLWETYLPAFKAAITEGNVHSVMSAYNAYQNIPMTANKQLLSDVLRKQWGFKGYVVSDCGAIVFIRWAFFYTNSETEAAASALKAGCDLDCGDDLYSKYLNNAINEGKVSEADIDTSVSRLLKSRFLLGLFDPPDSVPYNKIPDSVVDSKEHRSLSLKAAQESMVLLKNQNGILPLKKDLKSVYVIGTNADEPAAQLGNYTGIPSKRVTALNGIKNKLSPDTKISYEIGCYLPGKIPEVIEKKYLKTPEGIPGLKGEYFNNINLSGMPLLIRVDTLINFDWKGSSPATGINADSFSIRWTGTIMVKDSGQYLFRTKSDDGVRLFIDTNKIIDDWHDHSSSFDGATYTLNAGVKYPICLEYYENIGDANITLEFANDLTTGEKTLSEITERAKENDISIFVGGIHPVLESENNSTMDLPGFFGGDRTSLDLPLGQERILKALKNSGKPVILVLYSGSCLAINWENDSIPAILQAWYGGEEAGTAIADILFGDYNPAGRLPITYYKSLDDVPDFENYYMQDRTYRYFTKEPLFPFGYGLSYTSFNYSNLSIPFKDIDLCQKDTIPVIYTLKNIGNMDGDEVVQLYVIHRGSKIPLPLKELKGFKRIHLMKNEEITDTILLNLKELYYYDTTIHSYYIESGKYTIQLGASSSDIRLEDSISIYNCLDNVSQANDSNGDKIFPNPADETIYFELNSIPDVNYKIYIFDMMGNQINIKETSEVFKTSEVLGNKFSLNCSFLETGVYIIKLENKTNTYIRKFVLVK